MAFSVEDIRAKFPNKNIPKIIGEPTYKSINEMREALYENASATPTALGGVRNDHIGLAMGAAVYANVVTLHPSYKKQRPGRSTGMHRVCAPSS